MLVCKAKLVAQHINKYDAGTCASFDGGICASFEVEDTVFQLLVGQIVTFDTVPIIWNEKRCSRFGHVHLLPPLARTTTKNPGTTKTRTTVGDRLRDRHHAAHRRRDRPPRRRSARGRVHVRAPFPRHLRFPLSSFSSTTRRCSQRLVEKCQRLERISCDISRHNPKPIGCASLIQNPISMPVYIHVSER